MHRNQSKFQNSADWLLFNNGIIFTHWNGKKMTFKLGSSLEPGTGMLYIQGQDLAWPDVLTNLPKTDAHWLPE